MSLIEFNSSEDGKHKCSSKREGDWVVYSCPHCPDFQKRINLKTGEMESESDDTNYYLHSGSYTKPGIDAGHYNPN
jgi:hypothetical protein